MQRLLQPPFSFLHFTDFRNTALLVYLIKADKNQAAVYGINAAVVGLLLAMVLQLGQKVSSTGVI